MSRDRKAINEIICAVLPLPLLSGIFILLFIPDSFLHPWLMSSHGYSIIWEEIGCTFLFLHLFISEIQTDDRNASLTYHASLSLSKHCRYITSYHCMDEFRNISYEKAMRNTLPLIWVANPRKENVLDTTDNCIADENVDEGRQVESHWLEDFLQFEGSGGVRSKAWYRTGKELVTCSLRNWVWERYRDDEIRGKFDNASCQKNILYTLYGFYFLRHVGSFSYLPYRSSAAPL